MVHKFRHVKIKNQKQEAKLFKQRVFKAAFIIAILTLVLLGRLIYLQFFQYKLYKNLSEHNQLQLLPIEPKRGLIYDRNGVLLAENIPVFNLDVIPDYTKNINKTLAELQKIIEISPENIEQFKKALRQHRRFEHIPLKLKLNEAEVANFYVNQYRFPGVVIDAAMIRHYPLSNTLVSVTGYTGRINAQDLKTIDPINYSASNFIGKIGIEKYYEQQLHGKVGYKEVEVDASGRVIKTLKTIAPIPGDTLYLTIDSNLQQVAQDAFGDEQGALVAVNPNNGEILALVSHPGYDPNLFAKGIDQKSFDELQNSDSKPMFNRAIRGVFPIASTIKPILALQALDTGVISTDYSILDPGWFKLPTASHIYRDWQHGGHGNVNVTKAIMESCDTFFYTVAVKMGIEKIDEILYRFGYGKKTGIDLEEETTGIVASPEWKRAHTGKPWFPGDTVISGIGQGFMSTTPLQLAVAIATIAEHGKRYRPHLLLASKTTDVNKIKNEPTLLEPVQLKDTSLWDTIIAAMQKVVMDPKGTAYTSFGANPIYTIAGKTGGAQLFHHKIVNENPTPESEESIPKHLRNHKLFIAFAPIDHPKIAIAVISENSQIAPKIARKVLDYYFTTK